MGKTVFIKDTAIVGKDRTRDFYGVFLGVLREKGLENEVQLVRVVDIGVYGQGMAVRVLPENFLYTNVQETDIPAIVMESVIGGKPVQGKTSTQPSQQPQVIAVPQGDLAPPVPAPAMQAPASKGRGAFISRDCPRRLDPWPQSAPTQRSPA